MQCLGFFSSERRRYHSFSRVRRTISYLNVYDHACPWSIATICIHTVFLTNLYSLGVEGVPPCWRHHQIPSSTQTSTTYYDLFSPLLSIRTFEEMTIKHLLYTEKVPFLYTERACVLFSGFKIHLGKFLIWSKV